MTKSHDQVRPDTGATTGIPGFVHSYADWSSAQQIAADNLRKLVQDNAFDMIRVGFSDPHGIVRSKTLTPEVFISTLKSGVDYCVAPFTQDTGQAFALDPFSAGGGIGFPEIEGSADFVAVPDPLTFRTLPWTDRVGWVLADEYFKSGQPLPFSPRAALHKQLNRLAERGMTSLIGLEVEWYLTKLAPHTNSFEEVGGFGFPSAPPHVLPVNLGYQFNIEMYNDAVSDIIGPLCRYLRALGLPLRSAEHESGPGQMEFTFDPMEAMAAADAMILLRTATKQVAQRLGYHATFMCKPALVGCDPSGWHMHQSLSDSTTGANLFVSYDPDEILSPIGRHFSAGLMAHAGESSLLTTPTINGYQRYSSAHSLAPSIAGWSDDNRGAMIRVLAAPFDSSSHIENRIGEPAANPYLYIASQLISGLDGVDRQLDPGPLAADGNQGDGHHVPVTLDQAVEGLHSSALFREQLGDTLVDLMVGLKRNELARYKRAQGAEAEKVNGVSHWEQREYFRVY